MKNSNLTDENKMSNESALKSASLEDSLPYDKVNDLALAILYHSQSVFYIVQHGKFQTFSPQLMGSTGFSREELIKINPLDIVHPEDREMVRENAIQMLKDEKFKPYEFRIIDKEKNIKYVRETVTSINYAGSRATLGNWVELTEYKRVEANLRVSQENYQNFFNNLHDAALLADTETGIIIEANKQASDLFGRSHDELVGMHQSQMHPPDEAEKYKKVFLEHSAKKVNFLDEGLINNKGGVPIPVTISTSVSDINGKRYMLGIFHDITGRKRAEQALKESEEKYRNVVEGANDGICIIQDKVLRYVNAQLVNIWGGTYEELIDTPFTQFILPEELPSIMDKYARRLSGEQFPAVYQSVFCRKNGEKASVELKVGIISYLGKPAELVFIRDITEQKKIEQELKDSENKFSSAFRSNPSAISITTLKGGKFLEVNDGFSRDFGYSRDEVIGHSTRDFDTWVKPEELKEILHKLKVYGRVNNEEFSACTKSGEIRTMLFSAERININSQPCIIAMTTDISKRKKIEQALQESEEKFSKAFLASPNSIAISRISDGSFIEVNDSYLRSTGFSREEIIGHTVDELNFWVNEEDRSRMFSILEKNGRLENEEFIFRIKSGELRNWLFSLEKIAINGELCSICVMVDITKLRQIEKDLKESEEIFSTVFQTSPDCIALVKVGENIFVNVNDAFVKLNGFSREEVIGHTATEVNIWADEEERNRILKKMQEKGRVENEECHLRTKSGEIRIGLFSAEVVNIHGEVFSIAVTTDITERRQIEQALKESEEKFSVAFLSSPEIIGITNLDTGLYMEVNDSFVNTTGYSREELIGHPVTEINMFVEPQDAEKMAQIVQEQGGIKNLEMSFRMKSGEIRQWLCSSESTVINGHPCSIAVATDITERKKMEDELHKYKEHLEELVSVKTREIETSNQQLEQELKQRRHIEEELRDAIKRADSANKAKSEFLARMSHEIRTPIHGVMGTLDLLRDTKLEPEQQQYVNMSKTSAESLLNVINDILDFSKIEAGKLEIERKEFDLQGMLEDTLEAVAVSAHKKGLEIILQVEHNLPAYLIGDAAHLRQIIINLIGNAIKFTTQGEILLRVEPESIKENEVELHFSVKDTGIGIPKEKEQILFQPFEQVDGSNQRKYGGTGLGLSISRQLVTLMGGRIWFKSWQGEGSVFHFTAKFGKQTNSKQSENSLEIPPELRGTPLLLIDDNATYRSILKDTLTDFGFKVSEMNSGHTAIKELEDGTGTSRKYPVILLDKEMPEMDGLDTAKQIMTNLNQDTNIIMMLPSDNISNDFSACQESGISNFIVKPVKHSELIGTILKALGQEAKEQKPEEKVTSAESLSHTVPCKILVAEDNPTSQLIAKKILEKAGHIVQIAGTGIEVIRMLKESKFDIILMDVEMPEMSGIEATRIIRKEEESSKQHVPIVAMTAYAMKEDRQRCLDAGMDTYVSKPVNIDELQKIIKGFSSVNNNVLPAVDIEAAYKFVGGYKEILEEVVHIFLNEDYPEQRQKLKEGIAKSDAEAVKQAAHSIKGAVRSLGGKIPGDTAFKLEEMGRNNNLAGAEQALQQLEQEISQFAQYYTKFDWKK